VSPRARVYAIVGACALVAAGAVVGITAATHHSPPKPKEPCSASERRAIGPVSRWRARERSQPRSGRVRLELGLALYCAGDSEGAIVAWRSAKRVQPDSPAAVRASDLLHPNTPHGLPIFEPSFSRPRTKVQRLLVAGIRLQQELRPLSAERVYARAARLAPNDPDAQVAAAVGLYDKDDPSRAFGKLGPLVRRFPHAQVVRFHIGLLSIFLGDFAQARKELALARNEDPKTHFAREANELLKRLVNVGTR
jgi:tetratricopeptide (TPR) repeat protein